MDQAARIDYLQAMGIELWQLPPTAVTAEASQLVAEQPATRDRATATAAEPQPAEPDNSPVWQQLKEQVAACTACPLHQSRTQTVFGSGNQNASWMLIGEAPGESEDHQGEPFVGPAGQLLNEMLRAIGLNRNEVYIANLLKCRPTRNRDPEPTEVAACDAFLKQQIELVKPDIILAIGRFAAQSLLNTTTSISRLRGTIYRYAEIPLVVLYHPAYLLRRPSEKAKAWDDLQLALRTWRLKPEQPGKTK